MRIIDPHIHMVSRTTDDYQKIAVAGIHTVIEPAFWAGFDRTASGFRDYFHQLTVNEPARAKQYGIRHYTWICLNPKEAEDLVLADEVFSFMGEFLDRDNVLGVGEIGLNKNSRNELAILERHIALAADRGDLILVHTPHLEDKLKGTRMIMDAIRNESRIHPGRVIIDHGEEHTVSEILDRGHWVGLTLYPVTKCSPQRAVDILEMHGTERIWLNSAADWGESDPLATAKAADLMRRRGHSMAKVEKVFYHNPRTFLGQCPKFVVD